MALCPPPSSSPRRSWIQPKTTPHLVSEIPKSVSVVAGTSPCAPLPHHARRLQFTPLPPSTQPLPYAPPTRAAVSSPHPLAATPPDPFAPLARRKTRETTCPRQLVLQYHDVMAPVRPRYGDVRCSKPSGASCSSPAAPAAGSPGMVNACGRFPAAADFVHHQLRRWQALPLPQTPGP